MRMQSLIVRLSGTPGNKKLGSYSTLKIVTMATTTESHSRKSATRSDLFTVLIIQILNSGRIGE